MHWADVVAERLAERSKREKEEGGDGLVVVATGITPSGHIHIGNLREVITGDLLARAAADKGLDVRFIYIADTFDPLRRIYPFIADAPLLKGKDEAELEREWVGHVLSELPCPWECHPTYAEHFLEPFFSTLDRLGIRAERLHTHKLYAEGRYEAPARTVLEEVEEVRGLLNLYRPEGKKLPKDWWPYNPVCGRCRRITTTKVTGFFDPHVMYTCECEGHREEQRAHIGTDDGKLPWRVDWPARWYHLGVTCEPFGKDHAAASGSYDTGKAIVEKVLDRPAPEPVVYEWIKLGGKDMHSSTGVNVSAEEMLDKVPPQIIRFIITRIAPSKHIEFDPGFGLINIADEFQRLERRVFEDAEVEEDDVRRYVLSRADGKLPPAMPVQIPYSHLITLVQVEKDLESVVAKLERTEKMPPGEWLDNLKVSIETIRRWVASDFCPPGVRFDVQAEASGEMREKLSDPQRSFLGTLADRFSDEGFEWEPEPIHNTIHNTAKELGLSGKKAFVAVYTAILDRNRGPRAGFFLASLDRDFVVERFTELSE